MNLKRMLGKLHEWSSTYNGYLPRKLDLARKRLNSLYNRNDTAALVERKAILKEMDELLYKEEILWKQRSWIDKIKWGDRNTKFFQSKASRRSKKNNISRLRRNDGTVTKNVDEIHEIANSFFKHMYTCDGMVDPSLIIPLVN